MSEPQSTGEHRAQLTAARTCFRCSCVPPTGGTGDRRPLGDDGLVPMVPM